MIIKRIITSLFVILLIGQPSSSFLLEAHLSELIRQNKHNTKQLNFALKQNNLAALQLAVPSVPLHSEQWLVLTKKLAKTQGKSAYLLAEYYQADQANQAKAIFWYEQAIRLDFPQASIALAQHYFQQNHLTQAVSLLAQLPHKLSNTLTSAATILNINIAIKLGDIEKVSTLVNLDKALLQTTTQGQLLLNDIDKYQILLSKNLKQSLNKNEAITVSPAAINCDNSIQLFATSLEHLKHLEKVITDFKEQSINKAVCFAPVRYIAINALACHNKPEQAIRCDELHWQHKAHTINSRYLGVMLPKGGANVHLGILYFDAQDTIDVIAHEISHLLGFIDEYPLPLGHIKCQRSQNEIFSQNVAVLPNQYQGAREYVRRAVLKQLAWAKHIKKSTPILQPVIDVNAKHSWQLGTPKEYQHEVGVFKAQTCNNTAGELSGGFSAYKGVFPATKLQYFALKLPPLYGALLKENSKKYEMPSFHYNIALAAFQQLPAKHNELTPQKTAQAYYWLEQAIKRERDINKRKKLRQGRF